MEVKCTHCGFVFSTKTKVGRIHCKKCKRGFSFDKEAWNTYQRNRRKDPEIHRKHLEYNKKYREKYPEEWKQKGRDWYWANRERCLSKKRIKSRNKKQAIIEVLGGKCELCGYMKNYAALEIHHKNPDEKEHKLWYRDPNILEKDILLVCSNCHKEIHNPELEISPGG